MTNGDYFKEKERVRREAQKTTFKLYAGVFGFSLFITAIIIGFTGNRDSSNSESFPIFDAPNSEIDTVNTTDEVNNDTLQDNLEAQVNATFYNPVEAQTDDTYWTTATGFVIDTLNPYSHRIIAVSRDLENMGFGMGDTVWITGIDKPKAQGYEGWWIIQDRMNKKWKNKIDFLVASDMYMTKLTDIVMRHL